MRLFVTMILCTTTGFEKPTENSQYNVDMSLMLQLIWVFATNYLNVKMPYVSFPLFLIKLQLPSRKYNAVYNIIFWQVNALF